MTDWNNDVIYGMTDALGSLFFSIYKLNLQTGEITAMRVAEDVKGLIDKEQMNGDAFIKMMAEVFYHTRSQNELISTFNVLSLRKYREDGIEKVERELVRMYKGSYHRVSCIACLGSSNNPDSNIILAVQDINEQYTMRQNQYNMIQSLSSVYYTMYYVDLDVNLITAIDNQMDSDIMLTSRGNFSQMMMIYGNNCIHYDDREDFLKFMSRHHFQTALSFDNPFLEMEYRRIYDYGMEWIRAEVILVSMENEKPVRVLLATRNITAQKQKEEALQRTGMGYNRTQNKGEAEVSGYMGRTDSDAFQMYYKKTDFIKKLAKQLKFPINVVLGLANGMELHAADEDKVRMLAHEMKRCGNELLHITNELMDMSMIERGEFHLQQEPVPLVEFFSGLIEDWEEAVKERGHHLAAKQEVFAHDIALMDCKRMKQVFDSLMDNAIRYTPDGGELVFAIREKESCQSKTAFYEMMFKDNGYGMSEAFLSHIYEPFLPIQDYRVSDEQGLGLSMGIVKAIVEQMGGSIDIRSEVDKGTTIIINVELTVEEKPGNNNPETVATSERTVPPAITSFAGKKVLVYDKEEEVRDILSLTSVDMVQAGSLEEVYKRFETSALDEYQMIIVEVNPDSPKEIYIAEQIHSLYREDAADMPVIALISGSTRDGILEKDWNHIVDICEERGICEVLKKPVELSEFLKVIGWWMK